MNIRERDDQLMNPLNNILMLAYGTEGYEEIEKQVNRIVSILEKERIITPRRIINLDSLITNESHD